MCAVPVVQAASSCTNIQYSIIHSISIGGRPKVRPMRLSHIPHFFIHICSTLYIVNSLCRISISPSFSALCKMRTMDYGVIIQKPWRQNECTMIFNQQCQFVSQLFSHACFLLNSGGHLGGPDRAHAQIDELSLPLKFASLDGVKDLHSRSTVCTQR